MIGPNLDRTMIVINVILKKCEHFSKMSAIHTQHWDGGTKSLLLNCASSNPVK